MTELDAALVRRKLERIATNLEDLSAVADLSLDAYRSDRFRRKGVERMLQETVEAAVDTNAHLLRASGGAPPADYYESFIRLGRAGILDEELAEALAPSAGLRNRLVHEYDEIDDSIVLRAVGEALRLFPRYISSIEARLEAEGF